MSDFIIETIKTGRGRYQIVRHVLHLTECKKKAARTKRVPLTESVWFTTAAASRNRGYKPRGEYENHYFGYVAPEVCEWCMNPHTTSLARVEFWKFVFQSARDLVASQQEQRLRHLKEQADQLERIHPYTPLLKAVREAWIDGDTAPNPNPRRSSYRRDVTWKWQREGWRVGDAAVVACEFRFSNIHWSDVIRVQCVPEGLLMVVTEINHSTSVICEPNDARRLAAVFDVIENWVRTQ